MRGLRYDRGVRPKASIVRALHPRRRRGACRAPRAGGSSCTPPSASTGHGCSSRRSSRRTPPCRDERQYRTSPPTQLAESGLWAAPKLGSPGLFGLSLDTDTDLPGARLLQALRMRAQARSSLLKRLRCHLQRPPTLARTVYAQAHNLYDLVHMHPRLSSSQPATLVRYRAIPMVAQRAWSHRTDPARRSGWARRPRVAHSARTGTS